MAKGSGSTRSTSSRGVKSLVERYNATSQVRKYSEFEQKIPSIRRMLKAMPNGTEFSLEGYNSKYTKDGEYIVEESRVRTLGTMAFSPVGGGSYYRTETTRYDIDGNNYDWLFLNKIKLKQ